MSDRERAFGEFGILENTHRTIPDNRLCLADNVRVSPNGFRTDVEPHLIGLSLIDRDHLTSRAFQARCLDVINRKFDGYVFFRSRPQQVLGEIDLVYLDKRLPCLDTFRPKEGVRHRPTYQYCVRDIDEVPDQIDLVGNFRAANDRDVRLLCFRESVRERFDLLLHQESSGGLLYISSDARRGCMRAMGCAKG